MRESSSWWYAGLILFASGAVCAVAWWNPDPWYIAGSAFAVAIPIAWQWWRGSSVEPTDDFEFVEEPPQPVVRVERQRPRLAKTPPTDDTGRLVENLFADGRYALLLRPQLFELLNRDQQERAKEALDGEMGIVPGGEVGLAGTPGSKCDDDGRPVEKVVAIEAYFVDRFHVTNADYLRFIEAGGYEQISLWDAEIWPAVVGFVDRSGAPGPRFWNDGKFAAGAEEHPVVGVSWYEAAAYARWVGKRLPSDAEWVKAASWPVSAAGAKPRGRRYPWGEAMDRGRTNLWGNAGGTVPVNEMADGVSVGGIYQMTGNVWEWTSSMYGAWDVDPHALDLEGPCRSLRGGAFDTYFDAQASCQFQSGDRPLARKHNIGFRCAVGLCDVVSVMGMETGSPESESRESESLESGEDATSQGLAAPASLVAEEEADLQVTSAGGDLA